MPEIRRWSMGLVAILALPVVVIAATGGEGSGGLFSYFWDPRFSLAAFGAFVTYIFTPALSSGSETEESLEFSVVYDNLFVGGLTTYKTCIGVILWVIIGGLVALILGSPSTDRAAVIMGMGWTGLVVAGKGVQFKAKKAKES